jgi:hypothetical protein
LKKFEHRDRKSVEFTPGFAISTDNLMHLLAFGGRSELDIRTHHADVARRFRLAHRQSVHCYHVCCCTYSGQYIRNSQWRWSPDYAPRGPFNGAKRLDLNRKMAGNLRIDTGFLTFELTLVAEVFVAFD